MVIDPANLLRPGDLIRLPEILDEAFDWLGADIVLVHAKEPRLHELDQTTLRKLNRQALDPVTNIAFFMAKNSAETTQGFIEALSHFPSEEIADEPSVLFYWSYFIRLMAIGYNGAVIIHGLTEGEVEGRTALLRKVLEPAHVKD